MNAIARGGTPRVDDTGWESRDRPLIRDDTAVRLGPPEFEKPRVLGLGDGQKPRLFEGEELQNHA